MVIGGERGSKEAGQAGKRAGKQSDKQAGRQASKQASRQAGRQHSLSQLQLRTAPDVLAMTVSFNDFL